MNLSNLPPVGTPEYWRAIRQLTMRLKVDVDRLWGRVEGSAQNGVPGGGASIIGPTPSIGAIAEDFAQADAWGSCSCYDLALSRTSITVSYAARESFLPFPAGSRVATYVNTGVIGGVTFRRYVYSEPNFSIRPRQIELRVYANCELYCEVSAEVSATTLHRLLNAKCRGNTSLPYGGVGEPLDYVEIDL